MVFSFISMSRGSWFLRFLKNFFRFIGWGPTMMSQPFDNVGVLKSIFLFTIYWFQFVDLQFVDVNLSQKGGIMSAYGKKGQIEIGK